MGVEMPSRRRVLSIYAAGAVGLAAGGPLPVHSEHEWRGVAMGADARIKFSGIALGVAQDAAEMAITEIQRLEKAISLFDPESEICRLNEAGSLRHPSIDLRNALSIAAAAAKISEGLFDPTVQALWRTYVEWFANPNRNALPPENDLADARAKVDWRRVIVEASRVRLGPGQAVTLNGLGQGYVTDRVSDLLQRFGLNSILVDLGEQRAIGPRVDGTPWLVARDGAEPISLRKGAVATSEGAGCKFDEGGLAHHLFDPRTGLSAALWRSVTVFHRSAAIADALSTAFYAAGPQEIAAVLRRAPGIAVWATGRDGREWRWRSPPANPLS